MKVYYESGSVNCLEEYFINLGNTRVQVPVINLFLLKNVKLVYVIICSGLISWFVMFCHGSCFVMVRGGSSWFIMIHVFCHGSWWFIMVRGGSSWFMFCHGLWWFVMVHVLSWFVVVRHGSWWFVVVRHGSCFVMVRGGSSWFVVVRHGSCFVVVRGGSSWFNTYLTILK